MVKELALVSSKLDVSRLGKDLRNDLVQFPCSVGGETEAQGGRQGLSNARAHWAWARAEVQASDEALSSAPTLHSAQIVSCLRERGVYKFGHILEQQSHKWTWLRDAGRYLTFQTGDGEGKGERGWGGADLTMVQIPASWGK